MTATGVVGDWEAVLEKQDPQGRTTTMAYLDYLTEQEAQQALGPLLARHSGDGYSSGHVQKRDADADRGVRR